MNPNYAETNQPIPREAFYAYAQTVFLRNNHEQLKTIIQIVTEQYHLPEDTYDINDLMNKVAFGVVHEFFCTEISGSIISIYELCRKHILYLLL